MIYVVMLNGWFFLPGSFGFFRFNGHGTDYGMCCRCYGLDSSPGECISRSMFRVQDVKFSPFMRLFIECFLAAMKPRDQEFLERINRTLSSYAGVAPPNRTWNFKRGPTGWVPRFYDLGSGDILAEAGQFSHFICFRKGAMGQRLCFCLRFLKWRSMAVRIAAFQSFTLPPAHVDARGRRKLSGKLGLLCRQDYFILELLGNIYSLLWLHLNDLKPRSFSFRPT